MQRDPLRLICFLLLVAACGQCATVDDSRTNSAPIVPETILAQWGYRTVTNDVARQRDWQDQRFGPAAVRAQRIKAIAEVPRSPHTFYRFTLTEESYASSQAATNRVAGLLDIPRSVDTKTEPELLLCRGFAASNHVLIVSTDVYGFYLDELPKVFERLKFRVQRP